MKRQTEFLEKLIGLIEAAGIPYAVCGSLSSSLYGQPRATNDADIIIAPTPDQLDKLLGFGARSFARWETYRADQSKAADLLLRALKSGGDPLLKTIIEEQQIKDIA